MDETAVDDRVCEGCGGPPTDDDPMLECLGGHTGPDWHRACHAGIGCTRTCLEHNFGDED